jgi:hypothetical protein
MAYEVVLDLAQPSAYLGGGARVDVSTQNPPSAAPVPSKSEIQAEKESNGMETLEHAALTVAIGLGVLWLAGSTILKDARL